MATVTFRAQRQTTFVAPIEGRDPTDTTSLSEGLTIRRSDSATTLAISGEDSRVATIKALKILPGAATTLTKVSGLFVEIPTNSGPNASTSIVTNTYGQFIQGLTSASTGPQQNVYGLFVDRNTAGTVSNYSIYSAGDMKVGDTASGQSNTTSIVTDSTTFNLINTIATTVNIAGFATSLSLGTRAISSGTKTVNLGTGGSGGTTTVNVGVSAANGGVLNLNGSIVLSDLLSSTYGGTGVNNGGRTLTYTTGNITFDAAAGGSIMKLPSGSSNDVVLTDLSSAIVKNKTIKIGTGGDNTFQISYDGTATNLTTITGITDGNNVLATKAYVDSVKTGLDVKPSVRAATSGSLPTSSQTSGTSMLLTSTANETIASRSSLFDGVTLVLNDRVLVKDQTPKENGIYYVSNVGSVSVPWVLTRVDDFISAGFSATFTTGSTSITVSSVTGKIVTGQVITGTNIVPGTVILNYTGSVIVISSATTGASSGSYASTNVTSGAYVFCEEGTAGYGKNDNTGFVLTTNQDTTTAPTSPATPGLVFVNYVDNVNFTTFSSAGSYTATNGIQLSSSGGGGTFSLVANANTVAWLAAPTANNLYSVFDTAGSGGSVGSGQGSTNTTGSNTGAKVVFNYQPQFTNSIDSDGANSTFTAFNNSAITTLNIATATHNNQQINIGSGVVNNGTKTLYIGSGATGTSTTNLYIGASASTTNLYLQANTIISGKTTVSMFSGTNDNSMTQFDLVNGTGLQTLNIASASTSLTGFNIGTGAVSSAQTVQMFTGATGASSYSIATGATAASSTKQLFIGTGGVAVGSITQVTLGSTTASSTITLNSPTVSSGISAGTALNLFNGVTNLTAFSNTNTSQSYYFANGIISSGTKTFEIATGGAAGSTTNINLGGVSGAIKLNGGTITSDNATVNLLNASPVTTVNFAGNSTSISLGAGASTTINLNATSLVSSQSTVALLNTTSTTINFAGASTALNIGSSSTISTITGTVKSSSPILMGTNVANGGSAGTYHRVGDYLLYGTLATPATTATSVRLTTDGATASGSNVPVIPASSTWHMKLFVSVYSNSGEGASWEITTTFRRASTGNVVMLGDPVVIAATEGGSSTMQSLSVTITEDTTYQSPQISIAGGQVANTYYCAASIKTLEVG